MGIVAHYREQRLRKVKILHVEPNDFFRMLKGLDGTTVFHQMGIPEDARLIGAHYDSIRSVMQLLIESDEFPGVPEGVVPPELTVIISASHGPDWRIVPLSVSQDEGIAQSEVT